MPLHQEVKQLPKVSARVTEVRGTTLAISMAISLSKDQAIDSKDVTFDFDLNKDTNNSVAKEMGNELNLPMNFTKVIAKEIELLVEPYRRRQQQQIK